MLPLRGAIGARSRVTAGLAAAGASGSTAIRSPSQPPARTSNSPACAGGRAEGDALDVAADLEVEGELADVDLDRGDAVERRRFVDPARIHDVEEKDGARPCRRRVVLERQRDMPAAQFELIVVAPRTLAAS